MRDDDYEVVPLSSNEDPAESAKWEREKRIVVAREQETRREHEESRRTRIQR